MGRKKNVNVACLNFIQPDCPVSICPRPKDRERTNKSLYIWYKVNHVSSNIKSFDANVIEKLWLIAADIVEIKLSIYMNLNQQVWSTNQITGQVQMDQSKLTSKISPLNQKMTLSVANLFATVHCSSPKCLRNEIRTTRINVIKNIRAAACIVQRLI